MRVFIGLACLLIASGCASSVPPQAKNNAPPAEPRLVNLHTGYRATVGGAICFAPDGRALMLATAPEGMSQGNFSNARTELWESRDNGQTWTGPRVLHKGTRESFMLPVAILRLASGKVMLLAGLYGGYDMEGNDPEKSLMELHAQFSSDNGETWTKPKRIEATWRYANCPLQFLQLKSGRILIPSGGLTGEKGRSIVSAIYSDDEGKTWKRSPSILDVGGEGFESGPAEPTAVELPDGRVWMLMRTQTGVQWESFSADGGETWSDAAPSRFTSSSAPASFTKLRDGRIVIVWSNANAGPYTRHSLAAAISGDGGKTFHGFREIAKVEHPLDRLDRRWGVAYAYPAQAPDGTLLVPFNTGNWVQMNLRVARLDPDWIAQPSVVDDMSAGLGAWCDVGTTGVTYGPDISGGDGFETSVGYGAPGPSGVTRNVPLVRSGTVTLELVPRQGPTYVLLHNSFLDPGTFDAALLRVRFDADQGKAYIGAGTPTERKTGEKKFTPVYAYTAYPVGEEVAYPADLKPNAPCTVQIKIDAARNAATVSINGGPAVTRPLPAQIEGVCYVGVAAGENGKVRIRRVESRDDRE